MRFEQDKIKIGDIPVAELAAQFGTPLYVYDEQKIRDKAASAELGEETFDLRFCKEHN